MSDKRLEDLNIESTQTLITPEQLKKELPISDKAVAAVEQGRLAVRNILDRKDPRLFVVIGPCSIHDVQAAKEYAQRLKVQSSK